MRSYVKNEKGYGKVKFNTKAVKDAYSKAKTKRKQPTSVNLPEEVITALKVLALKMDVPYQTLMRKFIIDGLAKLQAA
ncbi:MAG: CopG family antitoxin [Pseudobdellovibrionaceae bacterium]